MNTRKREWDGGGLEHFKCHLDEEFKMYNVTYKEYFFLNGFHLHWMVKSTRKYKVGKVA